MKHTPQAIILLADGFEEIEAVTVVDVLRRADIVVDIIGVGERDVFGSHAIRLTTDYTLDELEHDVDMVILPGGIPGTLNLAKSDAVQQLVRRQAEAGRYLAAICAAPALVFGAFGFLAGKRWTGYPGLEDKVLGAEYCTDEVVVDGKIITSRGPGTAAAFAFELVRVLQGDATAGNVKTSMLFA